jgi:hypothetical protein
MFVDIIYRPASIQVKPTQLGPIDTASPYVRPDVFKYKHDGVLDKNWMMDNVQKHNISSNVPSSQTFRSYLKLNVYEL